MLLLSLLLLTAAAPPNGERRVPSAERRAPGAEADTDTTFAVSPGTRLRLESMNGDISVKAWDRNQVRVQAVHSRRDQVRISLAGSVLRIEATGRFGPAAEADFDLTVPAWMGLTLEGLNGSIAVEGVRAPLEISTLNGDVTVAGGAETVKLASTAGGIRLSDARGRITLNGTSDEIVVSDIQGDLVVENISGDIILQNIVSRSVDVQSVSGSIWYDGTIQDGGRYGLYAHSGDIYLGVAEAINATFSLSVFSGRISPGFPLPGPLTDDARGMGQRRSYRMGNGSAAVEIEVFSGSIHLLRPAELAGRLSRMLRERRH